MINKCVPGVESNHLKPFRDYHPRDRGPRAEPQINLLPKPTSIVYCHI